MSYQPDDVIDAAWVDRAAWVPDPDTYDGDQHEILRREAWADAVAEFMGDES